MLLPCELFVCVRDARRHHTESREAGEEANIEQQDDTSGM